MFCKYCGVKVPDGVSFCSSCGRPLGTASEAAAPVPEGYRPSPYYSEGKTTPIRVEPVAPVTPVVPVTPAPRKKSGGSAIFWVVGVFLVVAIVGLLTFAALQGWFSAGSTEKKDDDKTSTQSTQPTQPTEPSVDEDHYMVQWEGVSLVLPKDMTEQDRAVDYVVYTGSDMDVVIASYLLSDYADGLTSSQKFAEHFQSVMAEDYKELTLAHRAQVYYTAGVLKESDEYEINGFYVAADHGYIVTVYAEDKSAFQAQMIQIATGALIDETVVPAMPGQDPYEGTTTPSYEGITVYLDQAVTLSEEMEDGCDYENERMILSLYSGSLDTDWGDFETPADMAAAYSELLADIWDQTSVGVKNGRKYVLCQNDDGFTMVMGCYIKNDTWWEVRVYANTGDMTLSDMIAAATSGSVK